MNFEELDNRSRVWVYQANRPMTKEEQQQAQIEMDDFAKDWESHGEALNAVFSIVNDRFLVLGVEPPKGKLCGGSVDSSFRFVKDLGSRFNIDFFNRLKVVTVNETGEMEYTPFSKLKDFPDRTIFNTMVENKENYDKSFKVLVKDYLNALN